VRPLDSYPFDGPVKVMKIDVEGMELDVLEGASALIGRDRPLLYVECATEKHYRTLSRWLERRDYVHWESFNATPTHLFMPMERVTPEQRLQHLQIRAAQGEYRSTQLLREIRQRMSQALERERQAQAQAREAQAQAREAQAQAQQASQRESHAKAQEQQASQRVREAQAALSLEQRTREALAVEKAALASRLESGERQLDACKAQLAAAQQDRNSAENELSRSAASLERAVAELDGARLARQKLTRTVEVRQTRLEVMERREAAYAERLERVKGSAAYRLGSALLDVGRSPTGWLGLPGQVARIYRDARARKAANPTKAPGPLGHPSTPSGLEAPRPETMVSPVAAGLQRRTEAARLGAVDPDLRKLRVAGIMDEFTFHSFRPECDLLPLRVARWASQVEEFKPQLVFIESAWKGIDDEWALKVSNPSPELMGLIAWAREHDVPTVFWNKEDPVHFGGFLHVARAVDYVFTTDIDCIARYKREVGHDRVFLLPFAAQPSAHNPVERFPREDGFCFAGSYYLKYPERQRDFRSLLDVVKEIKPVEIFDRNYGRAHAHYEFPPEYQPYIVGSLPFDQIDKAYKGYRYGINMNTIKQSQTMFARRVFELLASNTVVVSNFSRGLRLMFGDLVVSSDASSEIRHRVRELADDDLRLRKFRLAGLRKVMTEHTYHHRLAYIVDKLGGALPQQPADRICAVAFASDADEAHALVATFRRQTFDAKHLCLIGAAPPAGSGGDDVSNVASPEQLPQDAGYSSAAWVAPMTAADYHGPNYLLDLHLASHYCDADAIGKATRFVGTPDRVALAETGQVYRVVDQLPARASLLRRDRFERLDLRDAAGLQRAVVAGGRQVAVDEFNFAQDATATPSETVRSTVGDLAGLRTGLELARDLLPRAEDIAPALQPSASAGMEALPGLSGAEMLALMPARAEASERDGELYLRVSVPADKHRYFYLERAFSRAELNLETNSRFQLLCKHDPSLDVRTVFEFLDEDGQKISHAINRAGEAYSLPLPARCRSVRFGLRLQGRGELHVHRLLVADVGERPTVVVPTSRQLVVLKQYPDYDDLYKYGFVHSRLRAYAEQDVAVDVFKLTSDESCAYREFEGIDVTTGDRDLLDLALAGGKYRHVMVHLMDRAIWEVIRRHLDHVKVTVWVHGAEIQVWQRRQFEFERMDEAEVQRQKRLSDQRRAFWREVLEVPHPNLRLVFVSQHFAEEVAGDLGLDLQRLPYRIIHNFIDPGLFPYVPKQPEDRHRILSIRPFASRKYANDLTVAAILALSSQSWFDELKITIVGDGEMFEEVTRPLQRFANVTLSKRFLTQREIAQLHREHGVFLCPTRMDAQGVSRDEAMSSGLVPVTNAVAAIPEFVDAQCGCLAPDEDHLELARAIEALHADAERFLMLSAAAAQRVRSQSGLDQTIRRELALIDD
jgi:spore maturation protein CgeB/glycosyltransferase involved in cell wall biosynthesis